MSDYISAVQLVFGLLIGALGFVIRTLYQKIDKLEENSRRDDANIVKSVCKLAARIDNNEDLRRGTDRDIYGIVSEISKSLSRMEGRMEK